MENFSISYTYIVLWLVSWIFMEGAKHIFRPRSAELKAEDREMLEEIYKIISYKNGTGRPLVYSDPELKTMVKILHDKTTILEIRQQEFRRETCEKLKRLKD